MFLIVAVFLLLVLVLLLSYLVCRLTCTLCCPCAQWIFGASAPTTWRPRKAWHDQR